MVDTVPGIKGLELERVAYFVPLTVSSVSVSDRKIGGNTLKVIGLVALENVDPTAVVST